MLLYNKFASGTRETMFVVLKSNHAIKTSSLFKTYYNLSNPACFLKKKYLVKINPHSLEQTSFRIMSKLFINYTSLCTIFCESKLSDIIQCRYYYTNENEAKCASLLVNSA